MKHDNQRRICLHLRKDKTEILRRIEKLVSPQALRYHYVVVQEHPQATLSAEGSIKFWEEKGSFRDARKGGLVSVLYVNSLIRWSIWRRVTSDEAPGGKIIKNLMNAISEVVKHLRRWTTNATQIRQWGTWPTWKYRKLPVLTGVNLIGMTGQYNAHIVHQVHSNSEIADACMYPPFR